MSRSFIAIALCFSVMGMTVVPAKYMPCCCKAARRSVGADTAPGRCCAMAVNTDADAQERGAHDSCHAMQARSARAVCCGHAQASRSMKAGTVISGPCHGCRCIQEMQIVALPGFAVTEKTYRVAEIGVPVAEMPCLAPAAQWAGSLPESGFPGIVITLQTCSFRC